MASFFVDIVLLFVTLVGYIQIQSNEKNFYIIFRIVLFFGFLAALSLVIIISQSPMRFIWFTTVVYIMFYMLGKREGWLWAAIITLVLITIYSYGSTILDLNKKEFFTWLFNMLIILVVVNWYEKIKEEAIHKQKNIQYLLEKEVEIKTAQLQEINNSLEERVREEIEKNRSREQIMLHQTRLAQMGEMISMIAHQWRQPLAAISATSGSIELQASINKLDKDVIQKKAHNIKITLENIGISVTLANNGKEAFNLRRTEVFDIIFMDIQMPVMNGIEATQAILAYEKEKKTTHIPIVALTANALKGDKERFLAEGMDQYLSKPIKHDEIKDILDLYFTDKPILDNTISNTEETLKKEFVDILLCKKEKGDLHTFNTLLQDLGYSVDKAENIEDLKKMIQSKNYTHVLLDRNLDGLSEDHEISQMMKNLSIKSILLVEDRHLVREEDYKNYTRVVLNIPNIKFLDHIIKLNLR